MKPIANAFKSDAKFPRFQLGYWSTAIACVLGLAVTFGVVFVVWLSDVQNFDAQQSARIDSRIKSISAQLRQYEDLVTAVQAYAEGSPDRSA